MSVDIDDLIRSNLKRLLAERSLQQNRLAEAIEKRPSEINDILAGRKPMGKDTMMRICRELGIEPWEFYWTERTPIVRDAREMADIEQRREAERVGIADMVREAEASWIVAAKKKSGALREDAAARPKRTHKRAG